MIYILSEIHGVKENAQAIEYVIRKYNIKSIYIEYYTALEKEVRNFIFNNKPLRSSKFLELSDDGRMYYELLVTLRNLAKEGQIKEAYCYATSKATSSWNEREEEYYKEFKKRYEKSTLRNCLIIIGNAHAKLLPHKQKGIKYIPFGFYLNKKYKIKVVEIIYARGEYYNFGIHKLSNRI